MLETHSKITFAVFHAQPPAAAESSEHESVSIQKRRETKYDQLIELLFRSAEIHHPDCRKVILTDSDTRFELPTAVEVSRYELDSSQMMYSRLAAQLDFVRSFDFRSHLILMDSDMLVNESLNELFSENFDLALSYREAPRLTKGIEEMPINGGLIVIKDTGKEPAIAFLERVLQEYQSAQLKKFRAWYGDQYALIEVVGRDRFFNRHNDFLEIGNANLRLLPCEKWNFTPSEKAKRYTRRFKGKKIVHFRGSRKKFMLLYWKAFLAPLAARNLRVKLLSLLAQAAMRWLRFTELLERKRRLD